MKTAVDTNVFSIMWEGRERAQLAESLLLEARRAGSLIVSAVTYAEMMANPAMQPDAVQKFLHDAKIDVDFAMGFAVWEEAGLRFRRYAERRRRSGGGEARGLLADFVVGAHALLRSDRLLTFDLRRYEKDFPEVTLMSTTLPRRH